MNQVTVQAATQAEYEYSFDHLNEEMTNLGAHSLDGQNWSPERALAATVLIDGLIQIRDRYGARAARHEIDQDLRWVRSDNTTWPYSFVSLCDYFNLEPECVRAIVWDWIRQAEAEHPNAGASSDHVRPSAKVVMLGRSRRRRN